MKKQTTLFKIWALFAILMVGSVSIFAQKTSELPFTEDFSDATRFNNLWTVIDNNTDSKTWTIETSSNRAKYTYSSGNIGDDYLITPLFNLTAGKTYKLNFTISSYSNTYPEKMKVLLGTGLTIADFDINSPLYDNNNIGGTVLSEEVYLNVNTTGQHSIAFYAYSDKNQYYLYLKDIKLEETANLPGKVTNEKILPAADNSLSATVSWTNPTLTALGAQLQQEDFTKIEIYRNNEASPVHTIPSPVIGAQESWIDNGIPTSGKCTYRIVPYNDVNAGTEISVTGWIGGALDLPYENALSTAELYSQMTVIDNNEDGKTWRLYASNYTQNEKAAIVADDYLVTPPVKLKTDAIYRLTYEMAGSGNNSGTTQKMKIKIGKGSTIAALSRELADYPVIEFNSFKVHEEYFSITENGDYNISFYCYSDANKGELKIRNLKIEQVVILPGAVTETTITPDPDKALKATISWKNPTLNFLGDPLKQSELTKIEIYRDNGDNPVYTITEAAKLQLETAQSWLDETVPTAGVHIYKIIPYNNESAGNSIEQSIWIGGGLTLPYENKFDSQAKFDEMTVIDNNSDNSTWIYYSLSTYARYDYSSSKNADDYLITPKLNLKKETNYKVTFEYQTTSSSYTQKLKVLLGKEATVDAQTILLRDYNNITQSSFTIATIYFTVDEDDDYNLSLYCYSDYNKRNFNVRNLKIEEITALPGAVTDAAITPDADKELKATIAWTNPAVNHLGTTLFASELTKIEIYRNDITDQAIHTITSGVVPGGLLSWTDTNISANGLYTYRIIPYNNDNAGTEIKLTSWIGDGLDIPYENTIATQDDFNNLLVVNANNDENTWIWDTKGYAKYTPNRYNDGNDYLITAPLNLKNGIRYKISYEYAREGSFASDYERMKVLLGKGISAADLNIQLKDYSNITHKDFITEELYYTPQEDGLFHLAFYCYSAYNKSTLRVKSIKLEESIVVPKAVTNESLTVGENKALEATLTWINPALNTFDETLQASELTAVNIYRNNEENPVGTITTLVVGAETSWKDESVPVNGLYTYRIIPYNGTHAGEAVAVSAWIGGGLEIPYENAIATKDDFALFSTLDNNGDGRTWAWDNSGCAIFDRLSEAADDYLFTPPLSLKDGVTYKLSFAYSGYNGMRAERMKVKIGKEKTAGAQDKELKDYPEIKSGMFTTDQIIFSVNEDEDYYISFYCYSDANGWSVKVKDIKIDETATVPAKVTDAGISPAVDNTLKATISWTNPSINTTNSTLLQKDLTKIAIFRDGNMDNPVYYIDNPVVGAEETWIDENVPATGTHNYTIIPYNDELTGESVTVSAWIGGGLELPYQNNFSEAEFADLNIIDANNDSRTWVYTSKNGITSAYYQQYSKPDDWIISPALELEKDKLYQVDFQFITDGGYMAFSDQRIKVTAGLGKDVADQTIAINDITITKDEYSSYGKTVSSSFTPDNDGTYYLGFHLCSEAGDYIHISRFSIREINMELTSDNEYKKDELDTAEETVSITGNVEWKATTNANWIILNDDTGAGNSGFTFNCETNTGDQRTGEIVIASTFITETITVHQSGVGISNLTATKVDALGKDVQLTWSAPQYDNIKFNLYRDGSVIADEIEELTYTDENLTLSDEPYCYTVSVVYTNGTESSLASQQCVTMATILNITSSVEYKKNELDTEVETVTIESNTDWTASTSNTWITLTGNANNSGSGNFTFTCEANTGDQRTGTITVTDGTIIRNISVHQSGTGITGITAEKTTEYGKDVRISWSVPQYDNISFNIYRDGEEIASGITGDSHTDTGLAVREQEYCYTISIAYTNGTASTQSASACMTIDEEVVGLITISGNESIYVSNPFTSQLIIKSTVNMSKVNVFTLEGRKMTSINTEGLQATIETSSWNNGIYMITIETENGTGTFKAIKK